MADYDSSLPIRTEAAGDVDIFLSDSITPTNKLKIQSNGSINTNISATDLDIRDLVFATDKVDVTGSSVTVAATDLDIRDLAFATDKVDVTGSSVTVSATDLDIRDLDAATDSVQANLKDGAGNDFSTSNPLPVAMASDQAGDEVVDFQTSSAIAKDASVNHDYTVTAGKTFLGEEAFISGSGKLKVEILVNGVAKYVGFNSTSNPNIRIPLAKILKANAAEVVRFTITNRDNQAQDLYSTLAGLEV